MRQMNGRGQSKLNGGKTDEKGRGDGRQNGRQANKKPAEQATAGGHSQRILRPAQASNKRPQMASLAAKQQLLMTMADLSPCR